MDDLDRAVRAYRDAQAGIPAAQDRAKRLVADARAEVVSKREALAVAIVHAAERGMRQKEIAARTGYTRESVRRILRAAGITAD